MSDTLHLHSPHAPGHDAPAAGQPWHSVQANNAPAHPLHQEQDPVTDWLLAQRHIDANEFAVLFAIHKLNARRPRSAWIRRTELCRSSGLRQVSLTRVLNDLRRKGLVGMSRHPVDSSRACYLLVVG